MEKIIKNELSSSSDPSVITAQNDSYALILGRERSFDYNWLQKTILNQFIIPELKYIKISYLI